MKIALQDKLKKKHPKLLGKLSHFELDNGWYMIIDALCQKIQGVIDENGIKQLQIAQVKEKFGGLRVYMDEYPQDSALFEQVMQLISEAESLSFNTCEVCGKEGSTGCEKGWIRTLCGIHKENE